MMEAIIITPEEVQEGLDKDARRQGLSDGYYGYAADPGDMEDRGRRIYLRAHREGKIKNRGGKAW